MHALFSAVIGAMGNLAKETGLEAKRVSSMPANERRAIEP
jgi:hypothetical protein